MDGIRTVAAITAGGVFIWAASKYFAGILLPFLIAYAASVVARPVTAWLAGKTGLSRKICGGATTLLTLFATVTLAIYLSGRLAEELSSFASGFEVAEEDVQRVIRNIREKLPFSADFFESTAYETVLAAFREAAISFGGKLTDFLTGLCAALPGSILSVFVCATSFYYFTSDGDGIAESLRSLLPEKFINVAGKAFSRLSVALFGYLRAYLLLMGVTFLELLAGLSVLRAPYALVVSFLVALVDALPVLGAGTVLVPWALFSFLRGETGFGAGLLALLCVMYAARQLLEPRLIGRFIGVHPFIALAAVFTGYRLCGIFGMLTAPLALYAARAVSETERKE